MSHTSPDQPLPRSHYLLVLVAGVLAHGLSLRAQFYMDDYMHLIGNARVMEGEGLFLWSRLLPYLAYFLIYKVAGFSAIAFHGLNLLIHLALSGFVLWSMRDFERYLLPPSASEKTGRGAMPLPLPLPLLLPLPLPLLVALVFACHPLASEPVNYARCTPILLVGAFSYVAAWATLRWFCVPERRGSSAMLVAGAVVGATFSKEPGLVHAVGSVSVVAWFCRGLIPEAEEGAEDKKKWLITGVITAALLALPAMYLFDVSTEALAKPDFINHMLTHGRVFWMYVQRMFLPIDLSVDHYILWTKSWHDWPVLIGMAGIAIVTGITVAYGKRNRLLAVAISLTMFHLLLRMGYVIGHEMMVEYRTYPSLPWLAVLIASLIAWIASRATLKLEVIRICTVAFVVFLGALSISRSILWSKPSALARDALRQYPDNNRARAALMKQLLLREQFEEIEQEHQAMLASVDKMTAFNSRVDASRRYDPQRLLGDWMVGEVSYAPALVQLKGPVVALAHMDRTIEVLRGEGIDGDEPGPLKDLIELRERVRAFKKSQ